MLPTSPWMWLSDVVSVDLSNTLQKSAVFILLKSINEIHVIVEYSSRDVQKFNTMWLYEVEH